MLLAGHKIMKKKLIVPISIVSAILFFVFGGQRLAISCVAKATTHFNPWPSDKRILYENRAEKIAEEVSKHLDTAIETVEKKQFGKFDKQVTIYVFANAKSFSRYTGMPEAVKGDCTGSEIHLSGKLLKTINEINGMLTHELSHAQLIQHLGIVKFNRSMPRWFREGLAINVSNGGGATNATEQETREYFILGKHFTPKVKGALFNLKLNTTAPIPPRIFYRQSGDFVMFMAHEYSSQYQKLIKGMQAGNSFQDMFTKSFNATPENMLGRYIDALKKNSETGSNLQKKYNIN
jgi:hypothetical protein